MVKQAKKRAAATAAEEKVSLIGKDGEAAPRPSLRTRRSEKLGLVESIRHAWTLPRLMKYMALCVATAVLTFLMLRKEQKSLHWEQYNSLLEPETREQRCYVSSMSNRGELKCSCPDPSQPIARSGKDGKAWRDHHNRLVWDAEHTDHNLDIVLIGDSITEQWNGTKNLGRTPIPGGRAPFEKHFTKDGGGSLEGLALGSAGDTGPNLLWHLKNGVLEPLNPKVWFILIGTNDIFSSQCTDRFVIADILNVLRVVHEQRPEAEFIIHGILPRKDPGSKKTQFLGRYWKRIQVINAQVKRFCEYHPNLHFMQGGSVFMEETELKGRRQMNVSRMDDGLHPTPEGLLAWGEQIVKTVNKVLTDAEKTRSGR